MKKRSKGVTFWGWVFIVGGFTGVLGVVNPQQAIKISGIGLVLFGTALSIANLITGIFLLKLNETARKAVMVLGAISIILIPFWLTPVFKYSYGQYYEGKRQYIIEKIEPEYQQKALADLESEKNNESSKKAVQVIFTIFFAGPVLMLELLPIIFFTRPKVKKQFR